MENILLLIFDILNFGLLIFLWFFTLKYYKNLPQIIPTHFDLDGKADAFGNKKWSFLMPVILLIFYFLFGYIVRSPESGNYPVKITAENENTQFLIMKIFIRWIYLLIALIFLNSQDYMFRYSSDDHVKPVVPISTAILAIIGSVAAIFIITNIFK